MKSVPFIVLMALISSTSCTTSPQPQIDEGYIDTEEVKLFYKTMGTGDPIVVLHGGPGFDHRQFLPFIWELAENHQVILFDQRGTGLSECTVDSTTITVGNFIKDIELVRQHFKIEEMNLLGHSWGGILAMHYSVSHPEKLKSLILCSCAASADCFDTMRRNYTAKRSEVDTALLEEIYGSTEFQNQDPEAIARFWAVFFRVYFVDPAYADQMDLVFTPNTIAHSDLVARYILTSIGQFNLHDELAVVDCPTLILHGDSDPMPPSYAEELQASIKQSELVICENTGHWLFIDGKDCFRDSILDFLARRK